LQPTHGIKASSLNSKRGKALLRSIPNKVFSPSSKTYGTQGTISRWMAAPWASSSRFITPIACRK
jgi:hypothetical protein